MRIISGSHKRRKIVPPKNLELRPTTDIAKEAVFNIIENRYIIANKSMLDLFSGTGNIAFEFASRGTKDVVAIDKNKDCINFINKTAKNFSLKVNAICSDSFKYVKYCEQKYDFIFADPPYNFKNYHELKDEIIKRNIINKNGLLVIEHDKNTVFHDKNSELRRYGRVHFSIFSL